MEAKGAIYVLQHMHDNDTVNDKKNHNNTRFESNDNYFW